ncbi:flavin-containing monooxygenase [Lentibacter sp. XHP0401]|jgi:cation diffusion facilitator CzcD-associated flavoprotein CzcO|uniref:flavin-containing monooxygenase n=1 Tax=Lentibacter sp. XHP0401 TaxID=2984334 RepID=UPI0021E72FB3|nr:NAD(P)/FAD-dependent oxidoreductase [Lentibacter sp. XHP0401]MCV2892771.1 NAD(P)/FAD-dependent oxidoreductase [Lentibacter sp. XHP0401]
MKIAVIGAGFAGLASCRHLRDFGHDVTVFEKVGDVGGVWSGSRTYPGITTQNGKDTYHMSDFPMPKDYPEWPTGPQVQAYLDSYAKKFGLMPSVRLNTEVVNTAQGEDGRWTVTTDEGSEVFDFLVIANGIFSRPSIPNFQGSEAFLQDGGRICHSSEFLNLEDAKDKDVLVIGYGKSSCDVAAAVGNAARSTSVIARELIWKSPRKFGGVLNYKYLLLTRMGEALFKYSRVQGVEKFLHGIGKPVRNAMVGGVQTITTKQLGLKKLGLVPEGNFEKIARSTVSLATDGFYDMVGTGKINVQRDTQIDRLIIEDRKRFAILANGKRLPADLIICGTGWHQEIPFLDDETKSKIMDDKGNFQLYNCVKPLDVENLLFNGYNSSFFSALSAEIGALWIAAYLAGDLKLPSKAEMLRLTDERLAWMAERTEGKHAKGTNIIPFSMHQIDELLTDLRLPIPRQQRFLEWLMPVKPSSYTKVTKRLKKRLGIS